MLVYIVTHNDDDLVYARELMRVFDTQEKAQSYIDSLPDRDRYQRKKSDFEIQVETVE